MVSVVMSVYKEKIEWLRQAIDSILGQTYRNLEFIIVCDNPNYSDGISLIKEYATLDSRIILVFNEENIGLTKSLNKGIRLASGKYIARMDADDYSFPKRIEKQVAFMERHKDIVASGTDAYMWNSGSCKRAHRKTSSKLLRSRIILDSPIFHPSAIIRRIVDGNVIQYNEDFKYSQDYALWISLMKKHELSNIDEPLIKYRISDQQISTSKHDEQRVYALRNQLDAVGLLDIELSAKELDLYQDITRRLEVEHDKNEVNDFIVGFMANIKNRKDLVYGEIASEWLLIFVNRICKSNSLINCLHDYLKLCNRIKYFSFYSLLSLISKYI